MLRTAAGVLVGYIVMAVAVVAGLFGLLAALGPKMLDPGAYAPRLTYCVASLAAGFVAALLGGFVARKLGGTRTAVLILTLLVAALGGGMAAMAAAEPRREPAPRAEGESLDPEKVAAIQQPVWVALANPVVGAAGLLLGGRAWRRV